ncbi:hypothetical protein JQX13_44080 [Archangium violaceum]|uniref:type VI secretion system protein IglI family protein n=1 Tax=Archangium violaceum TaxID=83451 RepID=UPI00193C6B32|nr:type VI secretion system protein IglI family protein [Archangium violaceum]QRK06970.1 hypothetical protein JQX13_44080 [Archangium violaceum]
MADTSPTAAPFDSTLLEQPRDKVEIPDAESAEERLERVLGLVARGAYAEASRAAEALLSEGMRDVRLVTPYLFGGFLEHGLRAMPVIFSSLAKVLTSQWESFGPAEKKTVFARSGLLWLFKTLSKHLQHHEIAKDETWHQWNTADNRVPLQDALTLAGEVNEALATTLPGSGCEGPFRQITHWLGTHLSALPSEPPPPADEPAHEESPEGASATHPDEDEEPEARARPTPAARPPEAPAPKGPVIPVSPALALLMRKLDAFDTLVERRDLARASVVASDVLHTLEHFDPRVYLPSLFARFFGGLGMHADVIERLLQSTDTLAFRALEQLYRVDLDAFMAAPPSSLSSEE